MKKTFEYNGETWTAYWNEKDYRGTKYVEVKAASQRFGHGTNMTWNNEKGWVKNSGYGYASIVADLFGFK